MPAISPYERATVQRRLEFLRAESYRLMDRRDLPPQVVASRLQKLLQNIQQLEQCLTSPVGSAVA